jgi:hypothetical protein
VGRADAGGTLEFVVEHEAEWATISGDGKAVKRVGRDDEQISRVGATSPGVDRLDALPREVKNELSVGVTVGGNLGIAVSIQLELAQHETQSVDFNFLNEQGTPGEHEIGFMLAKVGIVLTQVAVSE